MTEVPLTTWQLALTLLDEGSATFGADSTSAEFNMPTEHWIKVGRPGYIEITPKPVQQTSVLK